MPWQPLVSLDKYGCCIRSDDEECITERCKPRPY